MKSENTFLARRHTGRRKFSFENKLYIHITSNIIASISISFSPNERAGGERIKCVEWKKANERASGFFFSFFRAKTAFKILQYCHSHARCLTWWSYIMLYYILKLFLLPSSSFEQAAILLGASLNTHSPSFTFVFSLLAKLFFPSSPLLLNRSEYWWWQTLVAETTNNVSWKRQLRTRLSDNSEDEITVLVKIKDCVNHK